MVTNPVANYIKEGVFPDDFFKAVTSAVTRLVNHQDPESIELLEKHMIKSWSCLSEERAKQLFREYCGTL